MGVYNFLIGPEADGPQNRGAIGRYAGAESGTETNVITSSGDTRRMLTIGSAKVIIEDRTFTMQQDSPVESSFEDYQNNLCWICNESRGRWDMWMSCKHLFCEKCSSEMLRRRMPCPLCRVASTTVLRGNSVTPTS